MLTRSVVYTNLTQTIHSASSRGPIMTPTDRRVKRVLLLFYALKLSLSLQFAAAQSIDCKFVKNSAH